jgi:polar amino acid transport system substrate-binding protein
VEAGRRHPQNRCGVIAHGALRKQSPATPEISVKTIAIATAALICLASCASVLPVSPTVVADLAPTGKLRAGINLGNGVVATRDPATGSVGGIAVNVARELGRRLDVPVELAVFEQARNAVDALSAGALDVVFVAIEPVRADAMNFTAPYAEIEGVYAVPPGSPISTIADVDREGVRISVVARSNYDLFLSRTLKHAELVRAETTLGSADIFVSGKVDVLAGVKQRVDDAAAQLSGSRILPGRFMAIRQAIGTPKGRVAGLDYLRGFVEDIKASGLVAREIEQAGLRDTTVAPAAPPR